MKVLVSLLVRSSLLVLACSPIAALDFPGFGPGGLAVVGHPAGGWWLVGTDEPGTSLRAVRVARDGASGDDVTSDPLDDFPLVVHAVAIAPSERWLAVWSVDVSDPAVGVLRAAIFEPDGSRVVELDLAVPDAGIPAGALGATATGVAGGGFAIAWGARAAGTELVEAGTADLFVARFDAAGRRVAGPARVSEGPAGIRRPFGIAAGPGAVVVGWSSRDDATGAFDVETRVLAPDLAPRSGVVSFVEVFEELDQTGVLLTLRPDGRPVVAWNDWRRGLLEQIRNEVVLFQAFELDGTKIGFPIGGSFAAGGANPLAAAASRSGIAWLIGTRPGGSEIEASPTTLLGRSAGPARPLGLTFDAAARSVLAAADRSARLLVVVDRWPRPATGAVVEAVSPPPPEEEEALTSAELPGFRVWVRIEGDRPGAAEPICLAETLCASGAVPGRTEVLVRIVGPKANGFLWPTLAKLTTAVVEVWIEQSATGEVRYYRLPGAVPGSDILDGLFDRFGFRP